MLCEVRVGFGWFEEFVTVVSVLNHDHSQSGDHPLLCWETGNTGPFMILGLHQVSIASLGSGASLLMSSSYLHIPKVRSACFCETNVPIGDFCNDKGLMIELLLRIGTVLRAKVGGLPIRYHRLRPLA